MPTVQVGPGSDLELQEIADAMGKSRKVVVVTGAGISTNCGIPDFRSEHGLYSLIQAQYDAALQNPPWEQENTFDIDDRPRKKRRQWYYEVVAPDGRVVEVIDEDHQQSQATEQKQEPELSPRSRSTNTNTTTTSSRASTPSVQSSDDSSLSSCRSHTPELPSDFGLEETLAVSKANTPTSDEIVPSQRSSCKLSKTAGSSFANFPTSDSMTTFTSTSTSSSSSRSQSPAQSSDLPTNKNPLLLVTSNETTAEHWNCTTNGVPRTRAQVLLREESNVLSNPDDEEDRSIFPSSQSSSRASLPNLKGRDLFDSMVWSDPFQTSIFYMFISSLRQKIQEVESTTATHKFIRTLRDGGRLVRNYTQNIDCLEEREGLETDLSKGPGNRARFNHKIQREPRPDNIDGNHNLYGGVEVVPLHGSLTWLRCGICSKLSSWDEGDRKNATLSGAAPDCPFCEAYSVHRTGRGRRGLAVGRLRPDIVLYGEEHPGANLISPLVTHDLGLGPDVLLIMGTSLRVHGLKIMVKEFAKAVHAKGGKVVFVNRTKPSESTWGDVLDYWVQWDCDAWVEDLKERRSDIWLPQGTVKEDEKRKESVCGESKVPSRKPSRPQATRDDKANGVFVTFKILDNLAKCVDSDGQHATRSPYWQTPSRISNASAIQLAQPMKTVPSKNAPPKSKSKSIGTPRSAPPKPKSSRVPRSVPTKSSTATTSNPNSNKRKSLPACLQDDKNNVAYFVTQMWANLKKTAPSLGDPPRELQYPWKDLSNTPSFLKPFAFDDNCNQFPNIGGGTSGTSAGLLKHVNLISHPPSGSPIIPISQPVPRVISHSYGTRASGRMSLPDAIVVDGGRRSLSSSTSTSTSDCIVVATTEEGQADLELELPTNLPTPPASNDPMTPSAQRIKNMGRIGAILSSDSVDEWHDASEVLTSS